MIDYSNLEKSLKHLEEQYKNYLTLNTRNYLSQIDKEGITESVIQRFETCYDTLWKTLKRYLNETLGLPHVPNSPKPILKMAAENKLLSTGIEQWLCYADSRIATSHDYSGTKAQKALILMKNFIEDSISLYTIMSNKTWT